MDLHDSLEYLRPGVPFATSNNDYALTRWPEGFGPMPTLAECEAIWPTIQAEDAAAAQAAATATTNGLTLEQQAIAAIAANKVFYARASSTTAQVLAQVKALSRQNNALIRLLLKRLDAAD